MNTLSVIVKAIARHITAVILSALTALGLLPYMPEGWQESTEAAIGTALIIVFYAVYEKFLKPLWMKAFGEIQVEEAVRRSA